MSSTNTTKVEKFDPTPSGEVKIEKKVKELKVESPMRKSKSFDDSPARTSSELMLRKNQSYHKGSFPSRKKSTLKRFLKLNTKSGWARRMKFQNSKLSFSGSSRRIKKSLGKMWEPNSPYKIIWTIIMMILMMYSVIFIPIRAFFFIPSLFWIIPDVIIEIFYIIDFIVHFFIPMHPVTEKLKEIRRISNISRKKKFKKYLAFVSLKYLKSIYFWIDLFSIIPFELPFAYIFIPQFYTFFKLNRSIRLVRFNYYTDYFRQNFEKYIPMMYFRLFRSLFITFISAHFMSCLYFFIIYIQNDLTSDDFIVGGVDILSMSPLQQYVRSFFWAFITMTGYSNTNPATTAETVLSVFCSVVGLALYITIIGTVGSLVSNMDSSQREFERRKDEINSFMSFRKLSRDLKMQIIDYYDYLWKSRKSFNEEKILEDLPQHLKVELFLTLNRDVCTKIPLLKEASKQFIEAMVLLLKPKLALPFVDIVNYEDIQRHMYIVSSGSMEVLDKEGKFVKEIRAGGFFGDNYLMFNHVKSRYSVKTKNYCDVYVISKGEFRKCLSHFSEEEKVLMEAVEKLYPVEFQEEKRHKEKLKREKEDKKLRDRLEREEEKRIEREKRIKEANEKIINNSEKIKEKVEEKEKLKRMEEDELKKKASLTDVKKK